MKRWAMLMILVLSGCAPLVQTHKSSAGWQLLVEGKPFFVKGICYMAAKVGESSHDNTLRDWMIVDDDHDGRIDVAYQSWVDKNRNNRRDPDEKEVGDFALLKQMGANAVRLYHHASADPEIQKLTSNSLTYSHAPNKELLRTMHRDYGIWVMMGDLLGAYTVGSAADWVKGTDYSDPVQRANMMKSVEAMVREFKDEPYILIWALGNENNYDELTHTNAGRDPVVYAKFVNDAARRIHELDPNHPVCLVNGETINVEVYAKYAPSVDIFGLNSYRGWGFNTMWKEISSRWDRPVMLTEFGTGSPRVENGEIIEEVQSRIHEEAWLDIERHAADGTLEPHNSIGGFVFVWMDDWWQNGNPFQHDLGPGDMDWEWHGLFSQGDGKNSPLLRQPRKVYYMYQLLWTRKRASSGRYDLSK